MVEMEKRFAVDRRSKRITREDEEQRLPRRERAHQKWIQQKVPQEGFAIHPNGHILKAE
jgi:hypothetical protein